MKARNRLASRNLVVELIRCTNDHSAIFTFAIRSRFSPPEFPTSGPPCRSVRIMLPFCMDFPFCAFNAEIAEEDLQAQFRHRLSMKNGDNRNKSRRVIAFLRQ